MQRVKARSATTKRQLHGDPDRIDIIYTIALQRQFDPFLVTITDQKCRQKV